MISPSGSATKPAPSRASGASASDAPTPRAGTPEASGPDLAPPLLTAEELLAGADLEDDAEIPPELLRGVGAPVGRVRLRPLCLRDVQLIAKAAKGDEVLTSVLMIQRAVIEPELDQRTVSRMSSGLVRFLVDRINRISGLTSSDDEIREMAGAPIVQAFFVLAKEFGWTPEEIRGLTVGQVLGYLEMLNQSRRAAG